MIQWDDYKLLSVSGILGQHIVYPMIYIEQNGLGWRLQILRDQHSKIEELGNYDSRIAAKAAAGLLI